MPVCVYTFSVAPDSGASEESIALSLKATVSEHLMVQVTDRIFIAVILWVRESPWYQCG